MPPPPPSVAFQTSSVVATEATIDAVNILTAVSIPELPSLSPQPAAAAATAQGTATDVTNPLVALENHTAVELTAISRALTTANVMLGMLE